MDTTATVIVPDEPEFAEVEEAKPFAGKFEYLGVFGGTALWLLRERIEAKFEEPYFHPFNPGIYSWDPDEGGLWVAVDLDWQAKDRRKHKREALDRAAELATKTCPLNAGTFEPLARAIYRYLIQE